MNRKIFIGCIVSVFILILVSFTSVVGSETAQSSNKSVPTSPLFTTQTIRSNNKEAPEIQSNYLGKGSQLNLFPERSLNEDMFNKAMKLFNRNPAILNTLIDKMDNYPYFREMLNKYDINKLEVKNYLRILMEDPALLKEEMKNIQIDESNSNSPQPRGLSTSSPLGCFIVGLIVLPIITVVVTLVVLLFTLRILTCMNHNDCANEIAQEIWDQLLQDLMPA